MWRRMGEWRYSSTIFYLGTRRRWVVSFTPWPLFPLVKPRCTWELEMLCYCIGITMKGEWSWRTCMERSKCIAVWVGKPERQRLPQRSKHKLFTVSDEALWNTTLWPRGSRTHVRSRNGRWKTTRKWSVMFCKCLALRVTEVSRSHCLGLHRYHTHTPIIVSG
jgi:hypothetical protein